MRTILALIFLGMSFGLDASSSRAISDDEDDVENALLEQKRTHYFVQDNVEDGAVIDFSAYLYNDTAIPQNRALSSMLKRQREFQEDIDELQDSVSNLEKNMAKFQKTILKRMDKTDAKLGELTAKVAQLSLKQQPESQQNQSSASSSAQDKK